VVVKKIGKIVATFFVFLPLVLGGDMPVTTAPVPGCSTIHIVSSAAVVTSSTYAEVQRDALNATRFWLNGAHIPETATVRLVVRADTAGTGDVRLAVADGATLTGSEVSIYDDSMDVPPTSSDIRGLFDNDDVLYCLEARTDGVNDLTIHDAWLLIEW
jgi:hypothetical protein